MDVSSAEKAEKRRLAMLAIKKAESLTHKQIAETLSTVTDDYVSIRTVESWLCNPEARHHRPCPGWALFVLKSIYQKSNYL